MKILVNALSVAYGGGLIRTLNIINTFRQFPDIDFLILCPDIKYYKDVKSKNVTLLTISDLFLKKAVRTYTDIFLIPAIIKKYNPDLVLSLGNLPAVTKRYQVFLHDNPLASVINFRKFGYKRIKDVMINRLRNMLLAKRLNYVDHLITQTNIQLNTLKEVYPRQMKKVGKKSVIPPSVPEFQISKSIKCGSIYHINTDSTNLLCMSRYYPHKNIEMLLDLARIFRQNSSPFKIILTLSKSHGKGVSALLKKIKKEKLAGYIINIGEISPLCLTEIMKYIDALILPSLLESYSLTYLEAMFFQKPVFTSDLDFAHEACKNAAFYFNPADAGDIYSTIISAFQERKELKRKLNNEKSLLKNIHGWNTIMETVLKNIKI
jgi:glycosyltransferase involved in cell wall biosynthesis